MRQINDESLTFLLICRQKFHFTYIYFVAVYSLVFIHFTRLGYCQKSSFKMFRSVHHTMCSCSIKASIWVDFHNINTLVYAVTLLVNHLHLNVIEKNYKQLVRSFGREIMFAKRFFVCLYVCVVWVYIIKFAVISLIAKTLKGRPFRYMYSEDSESDRVLWPR